MTVKVQPKSRRPGIHGRAASALGSCLRVGVSEAAEAGRANRETCTAIARALGLPASAVVVAHGQTSRDKTLRITGDAVALGERLDRLWPPG